MNLYIKLKYLMPECYNFAQLWKFLGCSNLTTTLQGCHKLLHFVQGVYNLEGLLQIHGVFKLVATL